MGGRVCTKKPSKTRSYLRTLRIGIDMRKDTQDVDEELFAVVFNEVTSLVPMEVQYVISLYEKEIYHFHCIFLLRRGGGTGMILLPP